MVRCNSRCCAGRHSFLWISSLHCGLGAFGILDSWWHYWHEELTWALIQGALHIRWCRFFFKNVRSHTFCTKQEPLPLLLRILPQECVWWQGQVFLTVRPIRGGATLVPIKGVSVRVCVRVHVCTHACTRPFVGLNKMFLIVVSWNFIRKSKAGTYILKSRPPQTTGAMAQWTKGNRSLEIPRLEWICRWDRSRGPQ